MPEETENLNDPKYTLIVVAENGDVYRMTGEQWKTEGNKVQDFEGVGLINQLKEFGTYLAFIPTDVAVGIGQFCTVVNLQSILKNRP